MRKVLMLLVISSLIYNISYSQGCVAIRSTGAVCTQQHANTMKGWQINSSYRYFKSFRHFVGSEEQKHRMEENTEVINWQHSLDFTIIRNLDNRWSLGMYLPILSNKRSSLYEHGGNSGGASARHNTRSFGLGDIRFTVYRWMLDPATNRKGNVQLGLGVKLPTGNYTYEDFFIKSDGSKVLGPVDQSIQLGDGGTGFTMELNGYYNLNRSLSLYGNFYYLANPREQNGVSTARGGTPSATAIAYGSSVMSVPDQFMIRAGANYSIKNISFSAGIRNECLPSRDLFGGNNGFRRPGYIISFEPGINYSFKKFSAYATVPVALKRNRTQSEPDKLRTTATGNYAHGDAAFADYTINLGFSVKL